MSEAEETPLSVTRQGPVALVQLDRPAQRNALSTELLELLVLTLEQLDLDPGTRAIVIAGNPKVFASGADLRSLIASDAVDLYLGRRFLLWSAIRRVRTPLIAAVSGYCLGGGCELAMACDIVVASSTARFGLPETALGLVPAAGGTQLVPRSIGKAKAMDMILTGRLLDADEAEKAGLVSRVVGEEDWLASALEAAATIASRSPLASILAKELVMRALDVPLEAGFDLERKAFTLAFGASGTREAIDAFLEKRASPWNVHPQPEPEEAH